MKRNVDSALLSRAAATLDGKFVIKDIGFYVTHCTPSVIQLDLLNEHFISKVPIEMSHIKRSSTSKDVQQQNDWNFDLGVGEGTDLPL